MDSEYKYCKKQNECARSIFEGCPFDNLGEPTQYEENNPKNFCYAYEPEGK